MNQRALIFKILIFVLLAIVLTIMLLTIMPINFYAKPSSEEGAVLLSDESVYLNWDLTCAVPWDELSINQTDTPIADQLPHSVSFYIDGQMVKTVKIPNTIVFWMNEDQPITVFHTPKAKSTFIYQGTCHISSNYAYGLHDIMTIGDGFFAKCFVYKNEDN